MKTLNRNIKKMEQKGDAPVYVPSDRGFSLVDQLARFSVLRKATVLAAIFGGWNLFADQSGTDMPLHESSQILDSSNAFGKNAMGQRYGNFGIKNFPITPGSDKETNVNSKDTKVQLVAKSDILKNSWSALIADRLLQDELGVSIDADFLNNLDTYLRDTRNSIVIEYFDLEGKKTSSTKIKSKDELDKAAVYKYAPNSTAVVETGVLILKQRPSSIEISNKFRYFTNINSFETANNEYNQLWTNRLGVTIPVAFIPGVKKIPLLGGFLDGLILNVDGMFRIAGSEQKEQVANTGVAGNAGQTTGNDSSFGSMDRRFNLNQLNIYLQSQSGLKHMQLNIMGYANLWAGGATSSRAWDEFGAQFNIAPHVDAPVWVKALSFGAGSMTLGGSAYFEKYARGAATENTPEAKAAMIEQMNLMRFAAIFNNPFAQWQAARETGFYRHVALNWGVAVNKAFKNTLRDKLISSGIQMSEYENAFSMLGMAGITAYPEKYVSRGSKYFAFVPSFVKYEFMAAFLAANTTEHNLGVGYQFWRMQMVVNASIANQYAGVLNATPQNTNYSIGFEVRATLGE